MRVLVAPDSFKGSASAARVAAAVAAGWSAVRPDDELDLLPLADGGEGTVAVVAAGRPGARLHEQRVTGPDDRLVTARWVSLPDGTALVELAEASGLTLLRTPDPVGSHTAGLGEVVRAALGTRPRRLVIALGGSASTDGGSGALRALGLTVRDGRGATPALGSTALVDVSTVDGTGLVPAPPNGVQVLVDTDAVLTGPHGAAAVFGPQKGADVRQVAELDAALAHWAALLPADPPSQPGDGAAGGTGYGLRAGWGATLVPGAQAVLDLLAADTRLDAAELVITGEGRWDATSATGKLPSVLAARAADRGVPALLVAGAIDGPTDAFAATVSLNTLAGSATAAMAEPARWLTAAGRVLAAGRSRGS